MNKQLKNKIWKGEEKNKVQYIWIKKKTQLAYIHFCCLCFWDTKKNHCLGQYHGAFPLFSSGYFTISDILYIFNLSLFVYMMW
jgi:hypothetical protein